MDILIKRYIMYNKLGSQYMNKGHESLGASLWWEISSVADYNG